jgi:hypothetical protein
MTDRNIDFHELAKGLQGERSRRVLKVDHEIQKLEEEGLELTVKTLKEALNNQSITNNAISVILKDKLQVNVSESAIRRWRIDNGILRG